MKQLKTDGEQGIRFEALEQRRLLSAAMDLIGMTALRFDDALRSYDGSGTAVAVIDSGIDPSHPDLQDKVIENLSFVPSSMNPLLRDSHGTHVAGTIGSRNADIGVATGADIIGLQVFQRSEDGSVFAMDRHIESALRWVIDHAREHNIVAVNMSLGSGVFTSPSQASTLRYANEIAALESMGVAVVSAAGNGYLNPSYQRVGAGAPGILSSFVVGAVWDENEGPQPRLGNLVTARDHIAGFSARPPQIRGSIFAPGAFILSTVLNGRYATLAGTSMASPMVSGAIAVLQDAATDLLGRKLSVYELQEVLSDTSDSVIDGDDEQDTVENTGFDYSRLNIAAAVRSLLGEPDVPIVPGQDLDGVVMDATTIGRYTARNQYYTNDASIGFDDGNSVGARDIDLYRFEIASAIRLDIALTGDLALQGGGALRLFDERGEALRENAGQAMSVDLAPGAYYVGVSGRGNESYEVLEAATRADGETGAYRIEMLSRHIDPNGLFASAQGVDAGYDGDPLTYEGRLGSDLGVLTGRADTDIFEIPAIDDGVLIIDIDTPRFGHADTYLRVYDESLNLVRVSDDDLALNIRGSVLEAPGAGGLVYHANGSYGGHVTDSFAAIEVRRGETYYVVVTDYDFRNNDPRSMAGRVGSTGIAGDYTLLITFESWDVDGSIDTAELVVASPIRAIDGVIGIDQEDGQDVPPGEEDVDFFHVVAGEAGVIELRSTFVDSKATSRTSLRVFDVNGRLLASDDGADGEARLYFDVEAGTRYFVGVSGYGNDTYDPFQIGSGSPGEEGSYRFQARVFAPGVLRLRDDMIGDTHESLLLHTMFGGVLGRDGEMVTGAGDVDLLLFEPRTSGTYRFDAFATTLFGPNTLLRLFDGDGNVIAENDDANATTLDSVIEVELEAGETYYLGVSASGNGVYDPTDGGGVVDASVGGYAVRARLEAADIEPIGILPDAQLAGAAYSANGLAAIGLGTADRPIAYLLNNGAFNDRASESWTAYDLESSLGIRAAGGVTAWGEAGSDDAFFAVAARDGLIVVRRDANGGWETANLSELLGLESLITSSLTTFVSNDGMRYIGGITFDGDLVVAVRAASEVDAGSGWSLRNLSREDLRGRTPEFVGELISYVTPWNGLNIAGVDADGRIHSVWWAPGASRWSAADLTAATGAPAMVGGIDAYLTSWGGINLVGTDAGGVVYTTWWVPSFGSRWVTSNLTADAGGRPIMPGTLSTYVMSPWDGLNVAGLTADGDVQVFWWVASSAQNWRAATLARSAPVERLHAFTASDGRASILGTDETGDLVRLWWSPEWDASTGWLFENLTDVAL